MHRRRVTALGCALLAGLTTPSWSQTARLATKLESRCTAYGLEPGLSETVAWMDERGEVRSSGSAPEPREIQRVLTGDFTLVIVQTQGSSQREWLEYRLSMAAPPPGSPPGVVLTGEGRYIGTKTGAAALKRERHMDSVTTVTVLALPKSGGLTLGLDWLSSFLYVAQVWPDGRFRGAWRTGLDIGIEVKSPWGPVLETPAGFFCAWRSPHSAP